MTGGTGTYTSIEWFQGTIGSGINTGVTGLTNNTLCHTTDYYVTVTDNNGCQDDELVTVGSPNDFVVSWSTTPPSCNMLNPADPTDPPDPPDLIHRVVLT